MVFTAAGAACGGRHAGRVETEILAWRVQPIVRPNVVVAGTGAILLRQMLFEVLQMVGVCVCVSVSVGFSAERGNSGNGCHGQVQPSRSARRGYGLLVARQRMDVDEQATGKMKNRVAVVPERQCDVNSLPD